MLTFGFSVKVHSRPTEFRAIEVGECFVEVPLVDGVEGYKHRGIWVKCGAIRGRHLDCGWPGVSVTIQPTTRVYRVKLDITCTVDRPEGEDSKT
jgi:hypothetical protein